MTPDLVVFACELADAPATKAVMIGASPAGLIAAQRAGIRPIGFDETADSARLTAHTETVVANMASLQGLLL